MGRKKKVITEEEIEEQPSEEVIDTLTQDEESEASGIESFQSEYGGQDCKVRAYKWDELTRREMWIDAFPLETFNGLELAKAYGRGRYIFRLISPQGKQLRQVSMPYAGRPDEQPGLIKPVTPADDPMKNPAVMLVVEMLKGQASQMAEMLKAFVGRPQPEPQKVPGLTELVDALSKTQALTSTKGNSLKETLEMVALVKDMFGGNDDSPREGFLSDAMDALKVVKSMSNLNPRANPPAPTPIETEAVAMPRPPQAAPNPIDMKIREYIPILVSWAKSGKDSGEAGEFLLNEMLEQIIPVIQAHYRPGGISLSTDVIANALINYAQDKTKVEEIFKYAPALVPYREWVLQVIAKAVEYATTPEDVEPSEPAQPS